MLNRALELWIKITGIDPNSNTINIRDWDIQKINSQLKEAMALDSEQILPCLMLDYFATDFLDNRSFVVNDILKNYDSFQEYLSCCKELYSILQSEEIKEVKNHYEEITIDALKHYEINREDVLALVNDPHSLTFLRRDALKSLENLEVHQFFNGENTTNKSVKYIKTVHEFWNINSLIKMTLNMNSFDGISLNLIRDPFDLASYFAFTIKNGNNLFILTDKPQFAHPLQKYMARRPGRDLSERIYKNHFPYDLLNIQLDDRGDAFVASEKSTALTVYQEQLYPLKELKDLNPDEIVWIIMMFSLIEKKFFKDNFKCKELSYTGEMISNNEILKSCSSIKTLDNYEKLNLPSLVSENVNTDSMENDWEVSPTKQNSWIEERYEDKINNNLLNLMGNSSDDVKLLCSDGNIDEMALSEYNRRSNSIFSSDKISGKKLEALDTTSFGSKKELLNNQKWFARYNKAVMLKIEADKEFEERHTEVYEWYRNKITENISSLLQSVAYGEFITPYTERGTFSPNQNIVPKNILRVKERCDDDFMWGRHKGLKMYHQLTDKYNDNYRCYLTGTPSTLMATFSPDNPDALALLCGCKKEELPDVLQYWTKEEVYHGNHLISNIDPLEWVLKNPWRELQLNVIIYLSKSGYNSLRRENKLAPNKFWIKSDKK